MDLELVDKRKGSSVMEWLRLKRTGFVICQYRN